MIPECNHRFPNGNKCGSPALRSQIYCYFHHPARKPQPRKRRTRYPAIDVIPSINVNDRAEIQGALSGVLQALAANTISLYKAQTMIYALQLASNLNR